VPTASAQAEIEAPFAVPEHSQNGQYPTMVFQTGESFTASTEARYTLVGG
jgi:hypothetical protein